MPGPVVVQELSAPPTPEEAFRLLAGDDHPFFLDSGLRMAGLGRYSLLGSRPFLTLSVKGDRLETTEGGRTRRTRGNPFHALRAILRRHTLPRHPLIPFIAGAVGCLGYDLCHFIERLPRTTEDDIRFPDLHMALYDTALVYDHQEQRAWVAAAELGVAGRASAATRAGLLLERLRAAPTDVSAGADEAQAGASAITCNFSKPDYLRALQRCKEYIAAGDIFQVNLSRRFETRVSVPAAELYLRLRGRNPAPMAAYLAFDDWAVVSASPERFLKVDGGRVETRPIKGTRPRGRTPAEDAALAEELIRSAKDNAELAMIVDLERNDLGRVCSYGSVRVTEGRRLESFPTVHHLVATVEGDLHPGRDGIDLLRAAFPGGSITGAPKVRAMEIIDELEPTPRALYTGAIGYLGFDGRLDLNIVIRTILLRDGHAWFQAGGGIVADSELESEYEETTHKARALFEAVAAASTPPIQTGLTAVN